ncbi:MAG: hypothetical protein Q4A66_13125, partial [Eubacteriales bacterium]|nr:hypothetical protein [Eubacteriales bacterium]
MKRQLLLLMTAMATVLAAAVLCFSPYAPPVEPVPQQIETIWAIEDTRTPSETPLVTALENHGTPLAYDAQQNRFACTLGLDHSEGWPDIHLTAPGANGVRLMFSDDYAYDDCAEAVQEGYAYQVLAYTDTQYAYFEIVFTGLPMIIIDAPETITQEDTPVQIAISEHGEEAICSPGRAHVRGDRSVTWKPKTGYKLEFTRG